MERVTLTICALINSTVDYDSKKVEFIKVRFTKIIRSKKKLN